MTGSRTNQTPVRSLSPWQAAVLCGALGLLSGLGESVALAPVGDTTLLESAPDNNMGGWTHVAVGTTGSQADRTRNRGLFRFELADALPRGAKITNVVLTLTVTRVPGTAGGGGRVDSTFGLHRVLKSWGEGDKLGDRGEFATEGEATWNARFHPAEAWSAPGAAAPTDVVAQPSAETFISGKGSYRFGSTPSLITDVQAWANDPSANFGWLLWSRLESRPKTARAFASREDRANAPSLLIEFEPPAALGIERAEIVDGLFQLSFAAQAGQGYVVEVRDALASGEWSVLTNWPASPTATNHTAVDSASASQRFYRLRAE